MRLILVYILSIIIFLTHSCFALNFIEKKNFLSKKQRVNTSFSTPKPQREVFNKLSAQWNDKKPSQIEKLDTPTVPKRIHQVWLGNTTIPSRYQAYMQECRALHPEWEYTLWTEEEINRLDFITKDLYLSARSYPEKADIVRAAVLEKFGGVYLDSDILCIKPMDELLEYYDFVAGIEPNYDDPYAPITNNALTITKPHHPILKSVLQKQLLYTKSNHDKYEQLQEYNIDKQYFLVEIALLNTFRIYNEAVYEYMFSQEDKHSIVMPMDYFFPTLFRFQRNTKDDVNQYTFSIHDYTKSIRLLEFVPLEFSIEWRKQYTKHYILQNKYNRFTKADYRLNTIPKTMHFVNISDSNLSNDWKTGMYRTWTQKFWNKDSIYALANNTEKTLLDRTNSQKAFEVLSGIIILNKLGGVYIDNGAQVGAENFFDLIYTLDFFAGLTKMETDTPTASHRAFGVKPKHEITMRILEGLEAQDSQITLSMIQDMILQKGYEYINIDGLNTFLPQQYFEPTEEQEYSIIR